MWVRAIAHQRLSATPDWARLSISWRIYSSILPYCSLRKALAVAISGALGGIFIGVPDFCYRRLGFGDEQLFKILFCPQVDLLGELAGRFVNDRLPKY